MAFQPDPGTIRWRLHLGASPEVVCETLATDAGRARFWAEAAEEVDGVIRFRFLGGIAWDDRTRSSAGYVDNRTAG